MKKIFGLVMVVTILGAFMAGCSKPADDTSGASTTTGTTATGGTTGTTATTPPATTTGK